MVGFLEVATVAFVYQLAVLPGEKVQFIIAGLSTRFAPLTVVAAAGTAFAGWTALEIAFGEILHALLPGVVLDAFTAGMFLLFAVLLVRSAPATDATLDSAPEGADETAVADEDGDLDVSLFGRQVPTRFGPFLPIFALMAAGEFGDKTQIITFTLAAQYGAHPGIWVGEMLAIIPVSLANAYVFHRVGGRFDARKAHHAAATIFLFFAADTVFALLTGISVWEVGVDAVSEAILGSALGP